MEHGRLVEGERVMTANDKYIEKRVAREILNIIERNGWTEVK